MASTKILFLVAAACLFVAFAVSTLAITVGTDTVTDDVALESTSPYATTVDGELELDLDKLNERATTSVDDVFAISVSGDVEAVWIDHDVPGLEFYEETPGDGAISQSAPLEPEAGASTSVGVAVDTRVAYAGTETFTVHVVYPDDDEPAITLESIDVEPESLETGEPVTVTATYRNDGTATGTVTAELTVDGIVVATEDVTVAPGATESVTFERSMQWPGAFEIGVDGVAAQTVTADGPPIEVLEASIENDTVTAGDAATVEATVRNPTETAVDRTLELGVDGIVVESRSVTVDANSETTVSFERAFPESGTYAVAVSGVEAGTVTVSESEVMGLYNRDLAAVTTAALAPPMAIGLLFLLVAAGRRYTVGPFQ